MNMYTYMITSFIGRTYKAEHKI